MKLRKWIVPVPRDGKFGRQYFSVWCWQSLGLWALDIFAPNRLNYLMLAMFEYNFLILLNIYVGLRSHT